MDGSTKMVLDHCVPGLTVYPHQPDVASCTLQNNDTTHQTQYYAKTFITVDGKNVIIKDCSPSGNPVPYTLKNRLLTTLSQQTNKELSTDNDATINYSTLMNISYPNYPLTYPANWKASPGGSLVDPYGNNYYLYAINPKGFTMIFSGKNYCFNNELTMPTWVTTDNMIIDKDKSDQTPTFKLTTFDNCAFSSCFKDHMQYTPISNGNWNAEIEFTYAYLGTTDRTNTITYTCTKPKCANFTRVGKTAVYSRGDGTEFTDNKDISDIVNVCGTGSKLQ